MPPAAHLALVVPGGPDVPLLAVMVGAILLWR